MKKFFKVFLIIVVLLALGLGYFVNSLKPQYSGHLHLKGLSNKVEVYSDDFGIPHIYAQNQSDAYIALGYLHAQDRLWQMEVIRRIAPGHLAEIFGKNLIATDKFFASMGLETAAEKSIAALDKTTKQYKYTQAYLNGINQFIDNGPTPVEYFLTGTKKTHYTLNDVYNVFGYMSFSFAMAQKADPFFSEVKKNLKPLYLAELGLKPDPNTTLIHNHYQHISSPIAEVANSVANTIPSPFIGSNSWVVGASKSTTGKVLFANDPHMSYAQPGVWYEAYLKTPDYEMYGYHLAGIPFPLLGHNHRIAYGLTMFENDDLDFYRESVNPENANQYKTPKGWQNFETKTKTIKVKDGEDVTLKVRYSKHGPIMNDVISGIKDKAPIAMRWIYTKFPIKSLNAMFTMSHATNIQEFQKGAAMIHAPGLNIMYGDADNNIAWWAAGKIYRFNQGVNPKFVLDGASGNDEPIRYLDFSENPQAINPPWGYVYSANNQPDSIDGGYFYPGYYLPKDRAKRIVNLLESKEKFSKADFKAMIIDVKSSETPDNTAVLIKILAHKKELNTIEKQAFDILKKWDGSNQLKNIAPTIYYKWIYKVLKKTYQDELGEDGFTQFMRTDVAKIMESKQVQTQNSVWWDNVTTKNKIETRADILTASFNETIVDLTKQLGLDIQKWTWDRVHTLEHVHAITKAAPFLRKYLNVGPFKAPGAREVINNLMFSLNDDGLYKVSAGPSTRRIIDFSDIENSVSILPTGQSGNPLSAHYDDQALMYIKGQFRPMLMNKKEIMKSKDKLIFSPK
ncbi:MAG: penicillin acylase family protein [Alteromonadaceae bacterium]|nr:penicillin acylase family protein [Alteromonadaceae bacterium]